MVIVVLSELNSLYDIHTASLKYQGPSKISKPRFPSEISIVVIVNWLHSWSMNPIEGAATLS